MLEAFERAAKNKKNCKEVITYEMDLASNLIQTLQQLKAETYQVGKYREFQIYEPKKRNIQSLPFKDRVVQQWYVEEFIKPIFLPKFIKDSYACLEDREVHKAVHQLNRYLHNYGKQNTDAYILKCDISKFFYSINKEKMHQIIQKSVKDKQFLNLTKILIYHDDKPEGIPIGNYTSQYYANIYLNELDHFIKEELKIKYYVRYMDDFVLLLKNKETAKEILKKIKNFLNQNLKLDLNKKTNYFKIKQGVIFCGYRVYQDFILLKKENKKKIYASVKKWNQLYACQKLDLKETGPKLNSWIGHAQNANTYYLIRKVKKSCHWLYDEQIF